MCSGVGLAEEVVSPASKAKGILLGCVIGISLWIVDFVVVGTIYLIVTR